MALANGDEQEEPADDHIGLAPDAQLEELLKESPEFAYLLTTSTARRPRALSCRSHSTPASAMRGPPGQEIGLQSCVQRLQIVAAQPSMASSGARPPQFGAQHITAISPAMIMNCLRP